MKIYLVDFKLFVIKWHDNSCFCGFESESTSAIQRGGILYIIYPKVLQWKFLNFDFFLSSSLNVYAKRDTLYLPVNKSYVYLSISSLYIGLNKESAWMNIDYICKQPGAETSIIFTSHCVSSCVTQISISGPVLVDDRN